jgi:ATP-dependent Lon protease
VDPETTQNGKAEKSPPDRPEIPKILPVVAVRDQVVYPYMGAPLAVARPRSVEAIDQALKGDHMVALALQKDAQTEDPTPADLHEIGAAAVVIRMWKMPDKQVHLLVQGVARIRFQEWLSADPCLKATVEELEEPLPPKSVEWEAAIQTLLNLFQKFVQLSPNLPDEAVVTALNLDDPRKLCDFVVANVEVPLEQKYEALALADPFGRLQFVTRLLNEQLQVLELSGKIQSDARKEMEKTQREYYLRQQLREIQKELGETDDQQREIAEIREKIEAAKMPEKAKEAADRELDRLSKMNVAAAEYTVSRTYLDWLTILPWAVSTKDRLSINAAHRILEQDHYGLADVKERILEYLSVLKLKQDMRGPILCFVGPPGVGKTSLGKSIARALGRKFARVSLGGMRDEAEIRGHRRTYIGSLPGRIIQGLRNAGSNNPVFMLDEVDKLGADFRGDPASALLEVLDPQQNQEYMDHYLDVPFDLSTVMFVTTANILDPIPPALRDRMEVLELPGYTKEEKLGIASKYLVPRQLKEHGLTRRHLALRKSALQKIIRSYTREAGVRNLEREIGTVCRKVARKVAEGETTRRTVSARDLAGFLGAEKFYSEVAEREDAVGVATGMAWTAQGGHILFVESVRMSGKGGLKLTGQLGDVMQESAQAALSYLRSHADQYGITPDFFGKNEMHVHVPAGAIPKDGPSAGVTLVTSLASLATGKAARHDIAMTGEITLTGKVLPVGGIKEKVLGAREAGIRRIILPAKNKKDLEDVPEALRNELEFLFADRIEEVLEIALNGDPTGKRE